MKSRTFVATLAMIGLASAQSMLAGAIVWGNSASSGNVRLEAFDISGTTATLVQSFLVPNATAVNDNGRGVAVLGNTIYYTTANSGNIFITDSISHLDLGILASTGFAGIANVATDGTFIYASDYQTNSGVVNKYNTSGGLVGSVTVGTGQGRDGFEVQNNPLLDSGNTTFISNRGDLTSPYDVYKADGTLLVSAFINPTANGFNISQTGIAYDGTNYFVSDVFNNRLFKYSQSGAFIGIVDLSGIGRPSGTRYLEDLSAVGNTINNPPPSDTPEPASVLLLASGLIGVVALRRNRRSA